MQGNDASVEAMYQKMKAKLERVVPDVELRISTNHADSLATLNDLDTAVGEVLWRINLESGAGLPPGGSEIFLEAGDEIDETESSISIEELVSKYIFESDE